MNATHNNGQEIQRSRRRFGLLASVTLFISSLGVIIVLAAGRPVSLPYPEPGNPVDEKRIDSILAAMTVEEKLIMFRGNGLFTSPGVPRLGIPDLRYTDGPTGVREEMELKSWKSLGLTTDSATFFPTGSALAATWNPEMAYALGIGIGEETKARGKDILLAPAVNITRTPLNGRTFEYMSEDPFLNARLAVGYVRGVQQSGVAACVKHFAANNQETNRGRVNVIMDERSLREIYLPPFKAAVEEAKAYTVMSAYNKFRGNYCAENNYLLNKILREEWGFKGFVMSDWGGTHSTVPAALHGLDVEMGSGRFFGDSLFMAVKEGQIPMSLVDEKVRRILRVKLFTMQTPVPAPGLLSTPDHQKKAYDIAAQSIVLLKNPTNLLPLNLQTAKRIVVIGDNAIHTHASGGFGAGVKTRVEITPLQGLKNRLGKDVNIEFVAGYKPSYASRRGGFGRQPVNEPDSALLREAVMAARQADAVILCVGNNHDVETEATDRKSLVLPFGQDQLIRTVCEVNPRTIVVVVAGAPVDLHVANASAGAILWSWFNGSQAGNALADVILGKVNPSGKLPFTLPALLDDSPAHALGTFPGDSVAEYKEGILVGYRWFDTKKVEPLYRFGYGLSYSKFTYTDLKTDKKSYQASGTIKISLRLKNEGPVNGMETVQIYVRDMKPLVVKADKELKAFKKVLVETGKTISVELEIPVSELSYYDMDLGRWNLSAGSYEILAGSSSGDIRSKCEIRIK
ncbi:MAG: glycoside hydrolase family 3 C-terminal domain-containing protein [Bacteroidales bacterium]